MSLQKGDIYHGTGSSQSLIGNVIHKKNPPIEISLDLSQSLIGNVIHKETRNLEATICCSLLVSIPHR